MPITETVALLANLATAFGIPFAIIAFLVDRNRNRRERELETYRDLSDKYSQYLQILFEHPELSSVETDWAKEGGAETEPRQDLLVQMTINLIEAAYFLYRGHRSSFRKAQWQGWEEYLEAWCAHPAFRARWPELIEQYDEDFRAHIREIYKKVNASPKTKP
jgi:hypothetical protein